MCVCVCGRGWPGVCVCVCVCVWPRLAWCACACVCVCGQGWPGVCVCVGASAALTWSTRCCMRLSKRSLLTKPSLSYRKHLYRQSTMHVTSSQLFWRAALPGPKYLVSEIKQLLIVTLITDLFSKSWGGELNITLIKWLG